MARLILPNGDETEVKPANKKWFTLEEMQAHVGGYVEAIPLGNGKTLLVDEDGNSKRQPHNAPASALTGNRHVIVGKALLVGGSELR